MKCNNGFWDLPPEERAYRKERACEEHGVSDFFDLPPEERAKVYDELDRDTFERGYRY
jgi:hypothetical protein